MAAEDGNEMLTSVVDEMPDLVAGGCDIYGTSLNSVKDASNHSRGVVSAPYHPEMTSSTLNLIQGSPPFSATTTTSHLSSDPTSEEQSVVVYIDGRERDIG